MNTQFLILLLLLICNSSLRANSKDVVTPIVDSPINSVPGKITKKEAGDPLEYVSFSLFDSIDSSFVTEKITGMRGNFTLDKVSEGSYYVLTGFFGYNSKHLPEVNLSKQIDKTSRELLLLPIQLRNASVKS